MKKTIAVMFGGRSSEHEVSCVSATSVIRALDPEKYDVVMIGVTKDTGEFKRYDGPVEGLASGAWVSESDHLPMDDIPKICDFVLPIMHGPNAADGTIQGHLELLNIPYGGCGVVGCATAMDKIVAKEIFANAGLKQAPYVAFTSSRAADPALLNEIEASLNYPIFVKPANMGSSVGISKVTDRAGLSEAIRIASRYDERLVAEQGVNKARELENAVMGNEELFSGAVGEIIPAEDFYTYDAKYNNEASILKIPAPISAEETARIQAMAKKAYTALGCCGFSRVDFLMDGDTGEIYINEINAIPGFTNISMFPKLCMAAGMTYEEVVDRIIELGYERYTAKTNR